MGVAEDELAALVDDGKMEVGEEIAHQAGALHAEGTETVALTNGAEMKGEGDCGGVGTADEGVAAIDVTAVKEGDAETGVGGDDVGAGFGEGRQAPTNLPQKGRLFGEEKMVGVGDEDVGG